jgi:hypothetical protein
VALVFVSAAIAIAPWTAAAGTSCSDGKGDVAIVGRFLRVDDATATFRVEASSIGEHRSPNAPLPAQGTNVPVFFSGGDEFLRVGQRYEVQLSWIDGRFVSSVATAEDICPGGTTYADGSAIETSLLSRPHVKRLLLAIVVAFVVIVGLPAIWLRQRRQRRRRRNEAELRSAAG